MTEWFEQVFSVVNHVCLCSFSKAIMKRRYAYNASNLFLHSPLLTHSTNPTLLLWSNLPLTNIIPNMCTVSPIGFNHFTTTWYLSSCRTGPSQPPPLEGIASYNMLKRVPLLFFFCWTTAHALTTTVISPSPPIREYHVSVHDISFRFPKTHYLSRCTAGWRASEVCTTLLFQFTLLIHLICTQLSYD